MPLQVERRDGTGERAVVTALIVSRAVLGPVSVKWEPGLFPSRAANLIAGWCVTHYKKYGTAPHKHITGYFDAWAATATDAETTAAIEQLLASLSDEYTRLKETTQPEYLIDVAARLFNRNKLSDLKALIDADLQRGDVDRAEDRVTKFRRVELGLGAGIDVLTEEEAMRSAFEQKGEPVLTYPGALGNFFGEALCRDQFVAFLAPEKRGKSFWLLDMAWRAAEQGRKVAYIEAGDNSQAQVLRRLAARAARRPVNAARYEYPLEIESPGHDPLPELRTEWREERQPLTPEEASRALRGMAGDAPDRFKMTCHPNTTLSVSGIETILEAWERDGFHADLIVVDYADILAPLDGRADTREQINQTWKALRALSQKHHCLLVTATQSDADGYTAFTLSRENFSEDKRKNAHVTGIVGINQTAAEKKKGLYRLNWVHQRDLEFEEKTCVWCAGCLSVANPCVLSVF